MTSTYNRRLAEALADAQEILHVLGVPRCPRGVDNIYIVRIAEKQSNALRDFEAMRTKVLREGRSEWDSDKGNRISPGDWLGFITGGTYTANVELYRVDSILSQDKRPSHWEYAQHTDQCVSELVKTRDVISLSNEGEHVYSWENWKQVVGYKTRYMPRGTSKSKNPFN
jgi:hypothetical protein